MGLQGAIEVSINGFVVKFTRSDICSNRQMEWGLKRVYETHTLPRIHKKREYIREGRKKREVEMHISMTSLRWRGPSIYHCVLFEPSLGEKYVIEAWKKVHLLLYRLKSVLPSV
eukprot:1333715-Amorphochlora_amoeboformis.AAC.1